MLSRKQLKTIDGENKSDMKIFDAMKQYGFFKAVVVAVVLLTAVTVNAKQKPDTLRVLYWNIQN